MTSGVSLRNERKVGSTFEKKIHENHHINGLKRKTTIPSQNMRKRHLTKFIVHLRKSQYFWNGRKLPQSDKGHVQTTEC